MIHAVWALITVPDVDCQFHRFVLVENFLANEKSSIEGVSGQSKINGFLAMKIATIDDRSEPFHDTWPTRSVSSFVGGISIKIRATQVFQASERADNPFQRQIIFAPTAFDGFLEVVMTNIENVCLQIFW